MDSLQTWNITLHENAAEFKTGLANILKYCSFYRSLNCEIELCPHKDKKQLFKAVFSNNRVTLSCREKSAFFHALLCLAEETAFENDFEISRNLRFEKMSALLDISRNAVYTMNELKKFICTLALLGYNSCYLYMEDLYPLPEYPFFGYLRGSFSKSELKELDSFAQTVGIEIIPCIQALAHLRTALRWNYMEPMRDTDENLLVGSDATYELIDVMLRELSSIFKSRRIHLGMDEAMMIGKGISSLKFGYIPPAALMKEHLTRVSAIVEKYGLQPIVWDDMLFRSADVAGSYYGLRLDEAIGSGIHSDMQYAYWDYYHESTRHYENQLKVRKNLDIIFAGGIWKWTGFVPGYKKTWNTSYPAAEACEKHGVKEIIATIWADDGGETPLATILPGLALYGEHRTGTPSDQTVDARCRILSGVALEDYFAIEEFDFIPGYPRHNKEGTNPSKQILYSDILCGMYDTHYARPETAAHFACCAKAMREAANRTPKTDAMHNIFEMYAKMADVLEKKTMLGSNLRCAYKQNDKTALAELLAQTEELVPLVQLFHTAVVAVWNKSCKGQGLEVLDLRLGGLAGRFQSAAQRLRAYLNGEIEKLDELEQEILPYDGIEHGRPPVSYYAKIVTPNTLSHLW